MLNLLRTAKCQFCIAVAVTIGFGMLWFSFDGPIAIFPALLVPIWLPIFNRQRGPVSPRDLRILLITLGIGLPTLLVGIGVFVLRS